MVYVYSATDVASHLVAYTRERKGGYSWPSAAKSISKGVQPHKRKGFSRGLASSYHLRQRQQSLPWHSQIPQFEREAKSLYLLFRRAPVPLVVEGLLRRRKCVTLIHPTRRIDHIILEECIIEHAHEVRAIGCDSKLPLREIAR
ncbi:hypothetical protein Tco_0173291, partial [Tanacetum coccineum]